MGQAGEQDHSGAHCTRIVPHSVNLSPTYPKDLQIREKQHGSQTPVSPSWKTVGIGGRAAGPQDSPCHQQQAGAVLLQFCHHTRREQKNSTIINS